MNYRVHSGDTLSAIAKKFHTTVGALASNNQIKNVNMIYAGENLRVDSFTPSKGKGKPATGSGGSSATTGSSSVHVTAAMKRLAADAKKVALSMGGYHGLGRCATGVSRAIQQALGISVHGNGNQIDNNLPRSHFKEVHMSLAQALKTPGLVLTWEHTSTTLGQKFGHTAITAGDGHTSMSDFVERDTLSGSRGRTGLKIFMPI